jgi:hypothetical protein
MPDWELSDRISDLDIQNALGWMAGVVFSSA